ncbi:MAG: hypothetical protein ACWA5Q_02760 [bacterium]
MTTKLIQKHLLKGTQEFEIIDDTVHVRIKPPLGKEETLTVMLTVLNPEPVISKSVLEFTSRVNNEALLSLHLAKPNQNDFNAFVNLLKQKAEQEFNAFAGLKSGAPAELSGNVHEEPPEFDEPDRVQTAKNKKISTKGIEEAIMMLHEYVGNSGIEDFLASLDALKSEPESEAHLTQMISEFGKLGPKQGAVLSYAPYIGVLMSDDPYGNR